MRPVMAHSEELELLVLGSAMFDRAALEVAVGLLRPDDFYAPARAALFAHLAHLHSRGEAADGALVLQGAVGPAREAALDALDHVSARVEPLCARLLDLSAVRALTRACLAVAAEGSEPISDHADFFERAARAVTSALTRRGHDVTVTTLADAIGQHLEQLDRARNSPSGARDGAHTGLRALDGVLGGLAPGRLYVVAGRPSMGKSALAQLFASTVAAAGKVAQVVSLEMPAPEIAGRMVASRAGVDMRKLRDSDYAELVTAGAELSPLPIEFVERGGLTVEEICHMSRSRAVQGGLGLVVVDYLQLVRSGQQWGNREQEVASLSRALKALAMELRVPVVAVSQLNRAVETRSDKRPQLADLRESGAIEQDADAVLLLYREVYYRPDTDKQNVCEVCVAKNRGGPTGIVEVHFAPEFTRFADLERKWA